KARAMSDVSAEVAAKAAGLSSGELAALEDSGKFSKRPDFANLAQAIGLNGPKLEGIANGWHPSEKELSNWREVAVFKTTAEGITVNCYLVWDEVSREAALFDTGWDAKPILKTIEENQLVPRHMFITHSHPDHIAELGLIREAFPKIRVHSSSKHAPVDQ